MILTGSAIFSAVQAGHICIDPFDRANLNPNSYNYHLGETLLELSPDGRIERVLPFGPAGHILKPGRLYLGSTSEQIGSDKFVTLLLGRSSLGRLGIFLNVTADLGHLGSQSNWTLELTGVQPVRIYPKMKIGQVSFWLTDHTNGRAYRGRYHRDLLPVANRDRRIGSRHR
jgi:dCTP deaminase